MNPFVTSKRKKICEKEEKRESCRGAELQTLSTQLLKAEISNVFMMPKLCGSTEIVRWSGTLVAECSSWGQSSYGPFRRLFKGNRQTWFGICHPKLHSEPVTGEMILRQGWRTHSRFRTRLGGDQVVKHFGFAVMNYPSPKPCKQLQWKTNFLPTSSSLLMKRTKSGSRSYRQCYKDTQFLWFTFKHPCEQQKQRFCNEVSWNWKKIYMKRWWMLYPTRSNFFFFKHLIMPSCVIHWRRKIRWGPNFFWIRLK